MPSLVEVDLEDVRSDVDRLHLLRPGHLTLLLKHRLCRAGGLHKGIRKLLRVLNDIRQLLVRHLPAKGLRLRLSDRRLVTAQGRILAGDKRRRAVIPLLLMLLLLELCDGLLLQPLGVDRHSTIRGLDLVQVSPGALALVAAGVRAVRGDEALVAHRERNRPDAILREHQTGWLWR